MALAVNFTVLLLTPGTGIVVAGHAEELVYFFNSTGLITQGNYNGYEVAANDLGDLYYSLYNRSCAADCAGGGRDVMFRHPLSLCEEMTL